jgi:hypothetical protein
MTLQPLDATRDYMAAGSHQILSAGCLIMWRLHSQDKLSYFEWLARIHITQYTSYAYKVGTGHFVFIICITYFSASLWRLVLIPWMSCQCEHVTSTMLSFSIVNILFVLKWQNHNITMHGRIFRICFKTCINKTQSYFKIIKNCPMYLQ